MEPQEITCGTFRAVFGTAVCEQGECNLAYHEQECSECMYLASLERKYATFQDITCERFLEIESCGDKISEVEDGEHGRHLMTCHPCLVVYHRNMSQRMVQAICAGIQIKF